MNSIQDTYIQLRLKGLDDKEAWQEIESKTRISIPEELKIRSIEEYFYRERLNQIF